ncbi:MAG: hypothetical protein QXU09_03070 [Thermoproteota archaeon]
MGYKWGIIGVKEVIYSFDEFLEKVDLSKPLHHQGIYEFKDPNGFIHLLTFRIYGVSRSGGHVIVFEERHILTAFNIPEVYGDGSLFNRMKRWALDFYQSLVEKYAKPLNSTEGEIRE